MIESSAPATWLDFLVETQLILSWKYFRIVFLGKRLYGTKYSRMDQVKFAEDSL